MACLKPKYILTPESKFLLRCRKENRSWEYYATQVEYRRNKFIDPTPIVDNPHDYYTGKSLLRRMYVPCGKCELCNHRKVNDYMIRNYYEWRDLDPKCDSAYSICLTYADELLPTLDDGTPCFCSSDIKNFFKRFRALLSLQFSLSYFVAAELGTDDRYTHRPHYHGIIYLRGVPPTDENRWKIYEAVAKSWTKIVDRNARFRQLWDCQRISCDPVVSLKQITYVCKYIGKQFGAEDLDYTTQFDAEHKRKHWQSIGLGQAFWKYVTPDQLAKGQIEIDGFTYSIPNYYMLKIGREFYCYSDNGSIVYTPTDFRHYRNELLISECYNESCKLTALNSDYPDPRNYVRPDDLPLLLSSDADSLERWQCFKNDLFSWQHKHDLALAAQIQYNRLKRYRDSLTNVKIKK